MSSVFLSCAGREEEEGLEGNARVEIRVPIAKAASVLTSFNQREILDTMVALPIKDWW